MKGKSRLPYAMWVASSSHCTSEQKKRLNKEERFLPPRFSPCWDIRLPMTSKLASDWNLNYLTSCFTCLWIRIEPVPSAILYLDFLTSIMWTNFLQWSSISLFLYLTIYHLSICHLSAIYDNLFLYHYLPSMNWVSHLTHYK